MDNLACNYDLQATYEDGSCDYTCYGCTDPAAHNYDANATIDNGSCETCLDGMQNGNEAGIDCGGSCTGCDFLLYAQLLLEGVYNPATGFMNTGFTNGGSLPIGQPFFDAPFYYNGGEQALNPASDVVDWILVQIRDAADVNTVITQRAGLLRSDGAVTDTDGSTGLPLSGLLAGEVYRLVIYQQGHLGVMSNVDILGSAVMSYDFTTAVTQAAGIGQLKMAGSKAVLFAGDFDNNGVINNLDFNLWYSDNAAVNSYHSWDADINGVINNLDYNLWFANRSKVGIAEIQQ